MSALSFEWPETGRTDYHSHSESFTEEVCSRKVGSKGLRLLLEEASKTEFGTSTSKFVPGLKQNDRQTSIRRIEHVLEPNIKAKNTQRNYNGGRICTTLSPPASPK